MFLVVFCCVSFHYGQQGTTILGRVQEKGTNTPIHNAIIAFEGLSTEFFTDESGQFKVLVQHSGDILLILSAPDYTPKRFSLYLSGQTVDLGDIFLERDIEREKTDNLITLTDGDLLDDGETISGALGLLQSTKDIFLNRAAFDFGQAFFKVRGYDSRNGGVLINGVPMNKFFDGRPQWNNWGGLNE